MRVLYGIQTTGNGHLARARALTPELRKAGIEVDFVFSGRDPKQLFNMEVFGEQYRCYKGLTFFTHKGKISLIRTLCQNAPLQFLRDVKSLDVSHYDLVISDFEPVTAWAARKQKVPSLSISHQSAFHYAVPKVAGHFLSRTLMTIFAPTDYHIGLHWHHFNQPIVPPLIEPQQASPIIVNKILVYMGFESLSDIIAMLQPFSHCHIVIYANVEKAYRLNHILIEPFSYHRFHEDLLTCDGVISNAGFELASECIQLGKKLLVKPVSGQYEQLCNAKALIQLGRASVMENLDSQIVKTWIQQESFAPVVFPNVARTLAQWIKAGKFNDVESLQSLWRNFKPLASKPINGSLTSLRVN